MLFVPNLIANLVSKYKRICVIMFVFGFVFVPKLLMYCENVKVDNLEAYK